MQTQVLERTMAVDPAAARHPAVDREDIPADMLPQLLVWPNMLTPE